MSTVVAGRAGRQALPSRRRRVPAGRWRVPRLRRATLPGRRLAALPGPRPAPAPGSAPAPPGAGPQAPSEAGWAPLPRRQARIAAVLDRCPRRSVVLCAGLAATGGGAAAGPVAAGLAATYAATAALLLLRARVGSRLAAARTATLDTVAEMAAELRAGSPPAAVVAAAEPVLRSTPAEHAAVIAASRVSEATGAPLADVLERVEVQLRQAERLRLAAMAHRAGTRATALLLAVLPVGGVGLGYGIGADPLAMLLHTPLGAACAAGSGLLQLAGLAWTERLARVDP